jgi:D-alanyl-D-alanine carboxypeptidase
MVPPDQITACRQSARCGPIGEYVKAVCRNAAGPIEQRASGMGFCRVALAFATACLAVGGGAHAGPALLFDAGSGAVLYAEDQDNNWHPASLTKIMTAYVVFESIKTGKLALDQKIAMSELATTQPPSKIGLPAGAELTVEQALKILIIKSANDVAIMLAEAAAGSHEAFVERMNATAKRLGMTRTRFVNPNGLPAPEQVTTAHDLARLSRAAVRDFPEYGPWWAMSDFRIGKHHVASHNLLLKTFEGADGLKTGFICDSGFNVVASATRDGRRLMAVILGETTAGERNLRAASLLEHGFQQYGWKQLFNPKTIDNMAVAADAKPVAKMGETVHSWECGARKRIVRARQVRARVAAAKAAADGKPAVQAPAAAAAAAKKTPAAAGTAAAPAKPAAQAPGKPQPAAKQADGAQPKPRAATAAPKTE